MPLKQKKTREELIDMIGAKISLANLLVTVAADQNLGWVAQVLIFPTGVNVADIRDQVEQAAGELRDLYDLRPGPIGPLRHT